MKSLTQVFATLRKKNSQHYLLLTGCCFFSVLLITAYACMMRSPTVLNVLPEGGDSRKQVMMIFMLAILGCAVFTTYASSLFFRHKSRETGILLALGSSRRQIRKVFQKELAFLSLSACVLGALAGTLVAILLWQLFRLLLVDTPEMQLTLSIHSYWISLAFSLYVVAMIFFMLTRFIRRTNIIEVVNEARKSEPIRPVPKYYGWLGCLLLVAGGFLGYMTPAFFINLLKWYPPDALNIITYAPAFVGLYMILLHTVVNGWRRGKSRYKNIISTSMMMFQGRQTVRNMLVITVLVAGAYFGAFYTPMLGTGAMMGYNARPIDYMFHYRNDQTMPDEAAIHQMAASHHVSLTDYCAQPVARLGIDGEAHIETETPIGTTYTVEYSQLLHSAPFISESAWNALTGQNLDVAPGSLRAVFDDEGHSGYTGNNRIRWITNPVSGAQLEVSSSEDVLRFSMLTGYQVMDDTDYQQITQGLTNVWQETLVTFNAVEGTDAYAFAKQLFYALVDHSDSAVAVGEYWDPVQKQLAQEAGEPYLYDPDNMQNLGVPTPSFDQRDSSEFRMSWKYMPKFRVLDKADFVQTTAVFLMLFVFIALVCFSAVIIIAYTRSLTIALTNAQVYDDLRHLGATNQYLRKTLQAQISKVFFAPIAIGTTLIYLFYMMIMYFNDGASFVQSELAGLGSCLILIAVVSLLLYGIYRMTLKKVCRMLSIEPARSVSP